MTIKANLESLKNPSKDSFFILDIDSTLVTTHQRNQAILEDWIKKFRSEFPNDCKLLTKAQCQFGDYGLVHALNRIEFAEENAGSRKHLDDFWREHFFSNTYLHSDVPTRGAVHWAQSLEELGVDFVYLTARHKPTMWEGTLTSLDAMGFPVSAETLFLKEDLSLTDEEFKSKTMQSLLDQWKGKKIWFIDNEPVVLNRIQKDHPAIQLVWFESTHSGKMEPPAGVTVIQDFHFS